jgi:trans-2,3-dihydro-3-hydroxyanthranilate isomerase
MRKYPFLQIDAFAGRALEGNPCAVVFDSDDMDAELMQAIALENNLSETSFVRKSQIADFAARYFTPGEEIPLAGHPTIATVFGLVETGRLQLKGDRTTMQLELQVGPISVEIVAANGKVSEIIMSQKKPQFLRIYGPEEIVSCFGLTPGDLLPDYPIQTVSTGTPQLMIPLKNHNALRRASLNASLYGDLRKRADFFSPHLFCLCGFTAEGQTSARHLGVPPDTGEDPFTGSATGGMAAYLWKYGLLKEPRFIAEQGHWMKRPGKATVEVVGPRDEIQTVRVGGSAITVLRGELIL